MFLLKAAIDVICYPDIGCIYFNSVMVEVPEEVQEYASNVLFDVYKVADEKMVSLWSVILLLPSQTKSCLIKGDKLRWREKGAVNISLTSLVIDAILPRCMMIAIFADNLLYSYWLIGIRISCMGALATFAESSYLTAEILPVNYSTEINTGWQLQIMGVWRALS